MAAGRAQAGELRTRITVKAPSVDDSGEYMLDTYATLFGGPIWCRWTNVHGTEALTSGINGLREPATVLMRYSALVTPRCRLWHESDTEDCDAYEIISMDNVGDRREWLELKVQRVVVG